MEGRAEGVGLTQERTDRLWVSVREDSVSGPTERQTQSGLEKLEHVFSVSSLHLQFFFSVQEGEEKKREDKKRGIGHYF